MEIDYYSIQSATGVSKFLVYSKNMFNYIQYFKSIFKTKLTTVKKHMHMRSHPTLIPKTMEHIYK